MRASDNKRIPSVPFFSASSNTASISFHLLASSASFSSFLWVLLAASSTLFGCWVVCIGILLCIHHCQSHCHVVVVLNILQALLVIHNYWISVNIPGHEALLQLSLLLLCPFFSWLIKYFSEHQVSCGGVEQGVLDIIQLHIQEWWCSKVNNTTKFLFVCNLSTGRNIGHVDKYFALKLGVSRIIFVLFHNLLWIPGEPSMVINQFRIQDTPLRLCLLMWSKYRFQTLEAWSCWCLKIPVGVCLKNYQAIH